MSKILSIPKENIHDIAVLVLQKKTYSESDLIKLSAQISEDYLAVFNALTETGHKSWKGVSS